MDHRIDLFQREIEQGASVLEVGCGQGDCTVVLANIVGDSGHVTAIDPGSLDYGSSNDSTIRSD
jgi:ubiquinone/menaquinone biosynthesis C-methylase UbiE